MASPLRRALSAAAAASVLASGAAALAPSTAHAADGGHTSWESYGEYASGIGAGAASLTPDDASFSASGTAGAVVLEAGEASGPTWRASLWAGDGAQLTAGVTYPATEVWTGSGPMPARLDVQGAAGGCGGDALGSFTIREVEFADGALTRLSATFAQRCEHTTGADMTYGSIAWHATDPAPPAVDGVAPEPVRDVEMAPSTQGVGFTWVNPDVPDWRRTIVRGRVGTTAPTGPEDGFAVYAGGREDAAMNMTRPGTTYTFAIFTQDGELPARFSAPVVVRLGGAQLSLSAADRTISYFDDGRLRGRLTDARTGEPLAGKEIEVLARRPGSPEYLYVDGATTNSDGRWSLPVSPARTYDYWAYYRPRGEGTYGGAVEGPVRIAVGVGVLADVDRTSGKLGTTFEFAAAVGPARPGEYVQLQQLVDGKWRTVKSGKLYGYPKWTYVRLKPGKRGTFSYRFSMAGDGVRPAGTSSVLKIRVT